MRSRTLLILALAVAACSSGEGGDPPVTDGTTTTLVASTEEADTTGPEDESTVHAETTVHGETTVPGDTTTSAVDDTLDVDVPDVVSPTPSTQEGDDYPRVFPVEVDGDLVVYGEGEAASGEILELTGAVVSTDGTRLEGAIVEIWQADAAGGRPGSGDADPDFQGFGFTTTNANGAYLLRTVVPGPTEDGQAPHINVKVRVDGAEVLNTRIHLTGAGLDAGVEGDIPEGLSAEVVEGEEGREATFVLAVEP